MTALELMEEILADANTERRNRRIRAWFAADANAGRGPAHPVICAAMDVMSSDLSDRWLEAVCEALGGPPAEDPEPAESPGHGLPAGAKPGGTSGGRG